MDGFATVSVCSKGVRALHCAEGEGEAPVDQEDVCVRVFEGVVLRVRAAVALPVFVGVPVAVTVVVLLLLPVLLPVLLGDGVVVEVGVRDPVGVVEADVVGVAVCVVLEVGEGVRVEDMVLEEVTVGTVSE